MSNREIYPLVWHMTDPDVLAHRFNLPQELKEYTAVTVLPDQRGLAFLNSQLFYLDEPDNTYMLTGDRVDSVVQGYHIMKAGNNPVTAVNPQLTIFDMRVRERYSDFIGLTNSENRTLVSVRIVLSFRLGDRLEDVRKFLEYASVFRPGDSCTEIHLRDVSSSPAFDSAISIVSNFLTAKATGLTDSGSAKMMIQSACSNSLLKDSVSRELAARGLVLDGLHILPVDALCPYCHEELSPQDINAHRCFHCAEKLHNCPHCQALLTADHARCPVCRKNEELLFCYSDSCRTYRLPVRGRFCPVCSCACYPPRRPSY